MNHATIEELTDRVTGPVFGAGEDGSDAERAGFQTAFPHRSSVIVGALRADDVRAVAIGTCRRTLSRSLIARPRPRPNRSTPTLHPDIRVLAEHGGDLFGIITRQAIRRGSFTSVKNLINAIRTYIAAWNDRCHPFTWTEDADTILAKAKQSPTG